MFLKLPVLLAIVAVLLVLRWRRAGMLTWALAWWVAIFAFVRWGFAVPVPSSVVKLYMGIATLSILAYVSSSRERREEAARPILRLVLEPGLRLVLVAVVLLLPTLMALNVYMKMSVPLQAPSFGRTVHPAPPDEITVHEQKIDLIRAQNPYRELETTAPEEFRTHVERGRKIYFENCFYCHGDIAAGDGMFAPMLNPVPSNFIDINVLPILQESFVFWRVAKGGPGLPEESGPWDTAMPAWEKFLTVDEIWDVVTFLYDYTGKRPRPREEGHH
jgi:mono/diheme cytochrome c family protein